MVYSDYKLDQIIQAEPIYEQLYSKLLSLTDNEDIKEKMNRDII